MDIKLNLNNRFYIFPLALICIIAMLFLRDYVGVAIPAVVFLLFTTIVVVFGDKSDIINMCVCLIPMLNAFQTKFALIIAMVGYFFRFGEKTFKLKVLFPLIFLLFWEIVHNLTEDFVLVEIIRLFVELFFCLFVVSISHEDVDYNSMARTLAFTTICVSFIILLVQLKQVYYQVNLLFSGVYRFGYGLDMDELTVGFNPNILSFICLSSIECLSLVYFKGESTILDKAMIVLLVIFGLLTMSKKFILCGAIFIILLLLAQKNPWKKFKYLFAILLLGIVTLFILTKTFPSVTEMISSRFDTDDISTGRVDIMNFYNTQIVSSPGLALFGVGYHDYREKIEYIFNGEPIPHNEIQELIVMWGIPGLIAFYWFIKEIISSGLHVNKGIKFINFIPIFILLIFCMAAQMVSSTVIVMLIAVSYICLCENIENELREF